MLFFIPQQLPSVSSICKISLVKLKCVAQTQTTGKLTRSKAFARSRTNATAPRSSSFAFFHFSFHLHQSCPHCSLSSSIPAICTVPIHTVLLLPLCYLRCSEGFPLTYQLRHQRNRPFTRNIFWNQEEHRCACLLRLFATLLDCTFLMLFPSHLLSTSATLSQISSTTHSSKVCLAYSTLPHCIANIYDHSLLFASQLSHNLTSSPSFSEICAPPWCWLRDSVQKSSKSL